MTIEFGRPRHFDRIKLRHVLKYPIWVSAHDERYDEEHEKPIVNTTDVSESIDPLAPIITFKVQGADLYGSAHYTHAEGVLFAIAIWHRDQWVAIENLNILETPLTFVAVPTIRGQKDVSFVCNDRFEDRAYRNA